VASCEHVVQGLCFAVMKIGSGPIYSEKRRRIVLGPDLLAGVIPACADVVKVEGLFKPAVGVVGAAVAARAANFLTEENPLAPFGLGREFSRRRNMRRKREIK